MNYVESDCDEDSLECIELISPSLSIVDCNGNPISDSSILQIKSLLIFINEVGHFFEHMASLHAIEMNYFTIICVHEVNQSTVTEKFILGIDVSGTSMIKIPRTISDDATCLFIPLIMKALSSEFVCTFSSRSLSLMSCKVTPNSCLLLKTSMSNPVCPFAESIIGSSTMHKLLSEKNQFPIGEIVNGSVAAIISYCEARGIPAISVIVPVTNGLSVDALRSFETVLPLFELILNKSVDVPSINDYRKYLSEAGSLISASSNIYS